jgi:hypothetical protein
MTLGISPASRWNENPYYHLFYSEGVFPSRNALDRSSESSPSDDGSISDLAARGMGARNAKKTSANHRARQAAV